MKLQSGLLLAVFSVLVLNQTTMASLDYVSQTRYLFAEVVAGSGYDDGGGQVDASDFGVFDESVTALTSGSGVTSIATVDQFSELLPDSITATGSATGSITGSGGDSFAFGESAFSVNFEVLSDTDINITGLLSHNGGSDLLNTIRLIITEVGVGQVIQFNTPGGDLPIDHQMTLTAGEYNVMVSASFEYEGELSVDGSYDVSLAVVPEPATVIPFMFGIVALIRRRRR